jgi:hypothetical protein
VNTEQSSRDFSNLTARGAQAAPRGRGRGAQAAWQRGAAWAAPMYCGRRLYPTLTSNPQAS